MELIALDQHHIPLPATSMVGRSRELAEVMLTLGRPDVHLVTLTGPGGVGKTRLALQVAHDIDPVKAGEIVFVPLATVQEGASVLPAIARAIGARQVESVPIEQRLIATIGDRRMLLILDNAEHVAEHLTPLSSLLSHCRNLTVLVTSRVMLRLSAEIVLPVEPLATDSAGPDALAPASALFVERARAVRHDLSLSLENLQAIDEICRQLDGLPLAIELAAARTRFLSPTVLRDRLSERLPMLVGGPRDAPERHQTLRAALTWSHSLLTDDERTLFRRLAIFRGSAPLDAVDPVCNADGALGDRTEELLGSLVDHSLVRFIDRPATGPRVRLLNTIHEFAHEQLVQNDDIEGISHAHARWFADLVISQPHANWRTGTPELRDWTTRHDPDLENLRVSMEWTAERDKVTAVRLVTGLVPFWLEVGSIQDGRTWTQRMMPFAADAPVDVQARLNYMAGIMAIVSDDLDGAESYTRTALDLARQNDDQRLISNSQNLLGTVYWHTGRPEEGERLQRQAIETIRATADALGGAMYLANIGEHLLERDEFDRAEALIREALPVIREHRPDAVPLFEGPLAWASLNRGDLDEAGDLIARSLDYHRAPPHPQPYALAERLCATALLATQRGRPEHGARLLGAAGVLLQRTGIADHNIARRISERTTKESLLALLDREQCDREIAIGKRMSIPDAISLALEIARIRSSEPAPAGTNDHALTARQREILTQLAEGKSNAAIADALYISERTVTTHLTRIYDRLGVSTRTEAVARAARMGLISASRT